MQVRANVEAACDVKKQGIEVHPEIMIPIVGHWRELELSRRMTQKIVDEVLAERKTNATEIPVMIGTMIEVPRAAVTADEIARYAEFFSFGTNDLTQMGCGFSRDDAGRFLPDYVRIGIYEYDPFKVLDRDGVGRLVRTAVELGRKVKPKLKIGICGEHGGDPRSIEFCHEVGMNYVSCSPYRVPVARLSAAQAAIKHKAAKD
jgi:pyruvate, orthophosphate dikinase